MVERPAEEESYLGVTCPHLRTAIERYKKAGGTIEEFDKVTQEVVKRIGTANQALKKSTGARDRAAADATPADVFYEQFTVQTNSLSSSEVQWIRRQLKELWG